MQFWHAILAIIARLPLSSLPSCQETMIKFAAPKNSPMVKGRSFACAMISFTCCWIKRRGKKTHTTRDQPEPPALLDIYTKPSGGKWWVLTHHSFAILTAPCSQSCMPSWHQACHCQVPAGWLQLHPPLRIRCLVDVFQPISKKTVDIFHK